VRVIPFSGSDKREWTIGSIGATQCRHYVPRVKMNEMEVTEMETKPKKDSPGVIIFPPLLYLGTLFTGLAVHYLRPWNLMPGPWIRIAGAPLILAGGFVASWGRKAMLRAGTNIFPGKPTLAIVTDGPYRYTRNPLYLGNLIVYAGLALVFNSIWLLLFMVPMILIIEWGIIRREERYLAAKFGDLYLNYKATVRRWM
jgi:protein-S-isoprenylcysteine O-methyltransferase Ste14